MPGTSCTTTRRPSISTSAITCPIAGTSVSSPSGDVAIQMSLAGLATTSVIEPNDRPARVTTSHPSS